MTSFSQKLVDFLATGFYSGRSPFMPGTCGSIVACLLAFSLAQLFESGGWIVSIVFILAIIVCQLADKMELYGKDKDPQQIVIDEFAGYFTTICGLTWNIKTLFLGLIFFRIFDILKPPPIKFFEKLPGGYGVVADDILAGIFAAACLRLIL